MSISSRGIILVQKEVGNHDREAIGAEHGSHSGVWSRGRHELNYIPKRATLTAVLRRD